MVLHFMETKTKFDTDCKYVYLRKLKVSGKP